MFLHRLVFVPADFRSLLRKRCFAAGTGSWRWASFFILLLSIFQVPAVILWSDSGSTMARETGSGADILGGAVKRDDTSNDTLYFKFHLNPLSDVTTEGYFAAFELYEADAERLGIGNAFQAWAYSAFLGHDDSGEAANGGYIDLHSSKPEPAATSNSSSYEFPRRGAERTIVFKVQYIPGGDDLVTVWLNPDLGPGANEVYQSESLTTRFNADASFDEIRLRHGGGGEGWVFSDMAIATSFSDFVDNSSAKPGGGVPGGIGTAILSFRSWQREPAMPRGPLRAFAQTGDGYLWMGSDSGLRRFDGVRFTEIEMPPPFESAAVRVLLADSQGALWIGTASNGVAKYENGRFLKITTREGLPSDSITALEEGVQRKIWIGTDRGIACSQDGRIVSLGSRKEFDGRSVVGFSKETNGTIWAAVAGAGVFQFYHENWSQLTEPSISSLLLDCHCVFSARDGRLWIGAGSDFVLCRDGDLWRRYRIPRHSSHSYVTALAEEPDGTIWAGTPGEGLFQLKGGRLTAVNGANGLADNVVRSLFVDSDGKLWVGTETAVNRIQRRDLFVFGQNEGRGYGAVRSLAEVAPGVIWAIKPNDGLYRWEGGNFNRLTAAGLAPHDPALGAMLVARDHSCWVACRNGLLRFKDPQAVADESRFFALSNLTIVSLAEDPKGNISCGTREGQLWNLSAGKWIQRKDFTQSNPVTAIVPTADGSIWIGTDGSGLYHLRQGNWSRFGKNKGLRSDSIRTLYAGSRDTLWIGTANGGLSRWHDEGIETFTSREGLPDDTILQIVEDEAGRLWLGGVRGIACISKHDLEELNAGNASALYPRVYGKADGMLSEECAAGFFPAGLKTKSGLVWFSTLKGAVVADPRHVPAVGPPPVAVIEEVLVDGKAVSDLGVTSGSTFRIPPGRHSVEVDYTGPSFDAPEQTHFRYRLGDWDADWIDAGTRRTAFYNYVPPGKYRFQVIAGNSEGVWNGIGAIVELSADRYFWQAWWVLALAALGALTFVGTAVRLVEKRRLQRRLKRLEQERALERERTRIAQDLHDEMGAKLCRISFLSEHARRSGSAGGELQEQITSISDAARDVLHSLDEIVWAVNPQNDTLEHVASYLGQYAQDYFQLTGIECEVDLPAELPAHSVSSQVRHHLFLAVHEAFTNVLKHSGATRSKVIISCSDSELKINISDNGSGMNCNSFKGEKEGPLSATGDGLYNMRQRMADIGGDCQIESEAERGTHIQFAFPLNGNKSIDL